MSTPTDDLQDSDYQALQAFRQEIRRFLHFSETAARAAGIEPQQHQLLLALRASPTRELRVGDVAARLLIKPHSAAELVNRTEAQGLAVRRPSELDRREVHVQLTERGDSILRELTVHHRRELLRAGPALVAVLEAIIAGGGVAEAREALAAEMEDPS